MNNKNADDGSNPKRRKRKGSRKELGLSEYAASQLPDGAVLDFIFYEDFDNDGNKEAVIGVTRFTPFPPDSAVLIVKKGVSGEMEHKWLSMQDALLWQEHGVVFDNAVVADTDGDGLPELVISRVLSNEHDIDILVIDWNGENAYKAWHSERLFFHGSMEAYDFNGDGIEEIVAEYGTQDGREVISLEEGCYHVRESCIYKWDGLKYQPAPYSVKMPYVSYNTAVSFLTALWMRDYKGAYEMIVKPAFLGLDGLDDSSISAFKRYIDKKLLPALTRNLCKRKLIPAEPYETCCHFSGAEDDFTIELTKCGKDMKISGLDITKGIG